MSEISRDREGSRLKILGSLVLAQGRWITARQALGRFTTSGPWSEDLQDMVREGVVESQEPEDRMGNGTFVRLAPVYKQALGEQGHEGEDGQAQ